MLADKHCCGTQLTSALERNAILDSQASTLPIKSGAGCSDIRLRWRHLTYLGIYGWLEDLRGALEDLLQAPKGGVQLLVNGLACTGNRITPPDRLVSYQACPFPWQPAPARFH